MRSRLLSFGMVLFIGFLLAISLVLSASLAAVGNFMFGKLEVLLHLTTFLVSFGVITLLFAIVYKVLRNVKVDWEASESRRAGTSERGTRLRFKSHRTRCRLRRNRNHWCCRRQEETKRSATPN
jgi:predicted membrane protein